MWNGAVVAVVCEIGRGDETVFKSNQCVKRNWRSDVHACLDMRISAGGSRFRGRWTEYSIRSFDVSDVIGL